MWWVLCEEWGRRDRGTCLTHRTVPYHPYHDDASFTETLSSCSAVCEGVARCKQPRRRPTGATRMAGFKRFNSQLIFIYSIYSVQLGQGILRLEGGGP